MKNPLTRFECIRCHWNGSHIDLNLTDCGGRSCPKCGGAVIEIDTEQFEAECPKCGEPNCWAHGIVEMPEVELKEFIENTEAALGFMKVNSAIPYDAGKNGLSFETEIVNKQISDNESAFYTDLKVNDTFRIKNNAYKPNEFFVVIDADENRIIAVDRREMKRDTNPDGWRRLYLTPKHIEIYSKRDELEITK